MTGRNQHYLPRAFLRNFVQPPGVEYLYAFNKHTGKTIKVSLGRICQESFFYDFKDASGQIIEVDVAITEAENIVLPAFRAISNNPDEATLQANKYLLSQYVAFLMARSAMFRADHRDMLSVLRAANPSLNIPEPTEDSLKADHLRYMREGGIVEGAKRLHAMKWILSLNKTSTPFWASDYPFIMSGKRSQEVAVLADGTIALPSIVQRFYEPDIEVLMPLRPDVAIRFVDPDGFQAAPAVYDCTSDEVEGINSQLLEEAGRFVFSGTPDFQLAQRLLTDHPELADPSRQRLRIVDEGSH